MICATYTLNDAFVVKFSNDLDAGNIKDVRSEINYFSDLGKDVIIDIEKVGFIDSSGVGAIVFLYKRLIINKLNLSIVGLTGQPKQLFKMLHLDKTVACFTSIDDYLSSNNIKSRLVS